MDSLDVEPKKNFSLIQTIQIISAGTGRTASKTERDPQVWLFKPSGGWSTGSPFIQLHHSHRLEKVTLLMREGLTLHHLSLSPWPRFHSRSFLFLVAPSSLSAVQWDLQQEDASMLSACNRWQLWGSPWISAIAPVANYQNSSLGGPLLVTLQNKPPSYRQLIYKPAHVHRVYTFLIESIPTTEALLQSPNIKQTDE